MPVPSKLHMSRGAAAVLTGKGSEVVPSVADAGNGVDYGLPQEDQALKEQAPEALISDEQDSEEIPSEEADRKEGSGVVMKFNVPRTLALTLDFALEHFRENDRTKGPLYSFVEAKTS